MQRDTATVSDILKAARFVLVFIGDSNEDDFRNDYKTQAAVLHELLIIGEAAKRLSPDFRAAHPTVPWPHMAGMRDILIHNYDDVDLDAVWKTIRIDIPALIAALEPLVSPQAEEDNQ